MGIKTRKGKVPNFSNIEDMANYFDHTDTEELEWEDSKIKFKKPEMVHISVRIPQEDLVAIKKAAIKQGLGYTAFIRMMLHRMVNHGK
ncbi:MAG: hypothetical protein FH756_06985 [Firmicutes bacterium]|nr:hypothetical protein [Bacillota bacterium]